MSTPHELRDEIGFADMAKNFFATLDSDNDGKVNGSEFANFLRENGFLEDDPRLRSFFACLKAKSGRYREMTVDDFQSAVSGNQILFEKIFKGDLAIPAFSEFKEALIEIFDRVAEQENGGQVASYIPQLAVVDPKLFALSICTVDGQRFHVGDHDVDFCVQSCCKPINYSLALEEHGDEKVHKHIGREPSGQAFNKLTLNSANLPHNPMINAGAIMACSLIQGKEPLYSRFDYVIKSWTKLAGGQKIGFNNSVYLSEKQTADRNFCLGYMMREAKAFPDQTNLEETLEFYFQCCSIEATASRLATVAGTLANGGICPLTGEKVIQSSTVRNCLSLMYSCGLYDYSGEWAFQVGLPAKSGVSGCIYVVIPNLCGICVWSPPLDSIGNSVRGVAFFHQLVQRYTFHNFDSLVENSVKIDPRKKKSIKKQENSIHLLYAASEGDLFEVQRLIASGVDVDSADYDGRTALHLAASEGHTHIVEYLLRLHAFINPRDRWGGTPLNDALRHNRTDVVKIFEKNGAEK